MSMSKTQREGILQVIRTLESNKYEFKRHGPELDEMKEDFTDEEIDAVQAEALRQLQWMQDQMVDTLDACGASLSDSEKADTFWNS